jgi:hypothetical protein
MTENLYCNYDLGGNQLPFRYDGSTILCILLTGGHIFHVIVSFLQIPACPRPAWQIQGIRYPGQPVFSGSCAVFTTGCLLITCSGSLLTFERCV